MFLSLVLWSGNHLDGRKIGHCKLKLDKLFIFALVTQVTMLSMTVYAVLGKPDTSCFQCVNLLIDFFQTGENKSIVIFNFELIAI